MRTLDKILGKRHRPPTPRQENAPEPTSPIIGAERAEEKIFEEAKKKDEVISGVRTKLGDKK